MKEGLWSLVNGTEAEPDTADRQAAYAARRDKALAIIVLAIETKFIYLLGDPVDPQVVWKKLADQFQKKSWANRAQAQAVLNEADKGWIGAGAHESYDGGAG